MTDIETNVFKTESRIAQWGERLPSDVKYTPEKISAGLAKRLAKHAADHMTEAGFGMFLVDAACEVYSMDAEDTPANRSYTVKFKRPEGGYIEVIGILTRNGWPTLNHGFDIGHDT